MVNILCWKCYPWAPGRFRPHRQRSRCRPCRGDGPARGPQLRRNRVSNFPVLPRAALGANLCPDRWNTFVCKYRQISSHDVVDQFLSRPPRGSAGIIQGFLTQHILDNPWHNRKDFFCSRSVQLLLCEETTCLLVLVQFLVKKNPGYSGWGEIWFSVKYYLGKWTFICHGVKSFFPNHCPISFTLWIRQARRDTTSCQVHLGT